MRILVLSQLFDPEPTPKGLTFTRALIRAGHDVHVITGFPNYPTGTIYSGYRLRWCQRETIDGVRITRVPLYPSHDSSAFRRILTYVSFAMSATIAGLLTRFQADVMYVYHPPVTVGIAAAIIGFVRRIRFVYDVQDLWPDTLGATGMIASPHVLSLVGRAAAWVYARAATVVVQSPGFAQRLIDRGVPANKVRLIYNWCDEASLAQRETESSLNLDVLRDRFNVVFAGNMGKAQALETVIDAAAIVASQNDRVQFVFVGAGTEVATLAERARRVSPGNTVFLPGLPMRQVGHVLDVASALLVHLRDHSLFRITLPSKTQAYLFAGKPIVMAVPGDAAALVTQAAAGICAQSEDAQSIADAVLTLARLPDDERRSMGARGREYYDRSLSLEVGVQKMLEALEAR